MTKRRFLLVVILLSSLLLLGCGIPQEEYDAVIAERDSLQVELGLVKSELDDKKSELLSVQTELASVQNELETTKSELQSVQNGLDAKKSEVQSMRSQLSSSQSTVRSLQTKIDKATEYGKALHVAMYPTRLVYDIPQKLHYPSSGDWCEAIKEYADATEDHTLKNIAVDICAELSGSVSRFWSHGIIMLVRTLEE